MNRPAGITMAALIVTVVLAFAAATMWIVTGWLFVARDVDAAKEAAIQATAVSAMLVGLLAKTGSSTQDVNVVNQPGDPVPTTEE